MRTALYCLLPAFILSSGSPSFGGVVIDTLSSWDGTTGLSGFGEPDTSYVGQSFIALDTMVSSISFVLDGEDWEGAPYPTEFHLLLAPLASTGDRPDFDNVLFESGDLSTTLNTGFELFEIGVNTPVVPGESYLWTLDAFVLLDDVRGNAAIAINPDSYADGVFLFFNTSLHGPSDRFDHDDWPWHTWTPDTDLAFRIVFVPEPATGVLAALAFAALSVTRRLRSRTSVAQVLSQEVIE